MLIGAEGAKTPAGVRGRGDPAGAIALRRVPGTPAESEAPRAGINSSFQRTHTFKGNFSVPLHKVGGIKYKWFKKTLEPSDSLNADSLSYRREMGEVH
jgi:hypothetical protein